MKRQEGHRGRGAPLYNPKSTLNIAQLEVRGKTLKPSAKPSGQRPKPKRK